LKIEKESKGIRKFPWRPDIDNFWKSLFTFHTKRLKLHWG